MTEHAKIFQIKIILFRFMPILMHKKNMSDNMKVYNFLI